MKPVCILLFILLSCLGCGSAQPIGVMQTVVEFEPRRPLLLTIWYPTGVIVQQEIAGNAIFQGQMAGKGAKPVAGKHPLMLLSHGGFRSAKDSGSWLGAEFARAGTVVVEITRPNQLDPSVAIEELWRRAQDFSEILDYLQNDDLWKSRINNDQIIVAGFALGGTAAMSIAGAKLNFDLFKRTCSNPSVIASRNCDWLLPELEQLSGDERALLATAKTDPRVDAVVAIAPEFPQAMVFESLMADLPILIILLGPDHFPTTMKGDVSRIGLSSVTHVDAFPLCKQDAMRFLIQNNADTSLCAHGPAPRDSVHRRIIRLITKFLHSRLVLDGYYNQLDARRTPT